MSADKGEIAFHLVMALIVDLAVHDEARLARMQHTLANILEKLPSRGDEADAARSAYDLLLQLPGKG